MRTILSLLLVIFVFSPAFSKKKTERTMNEVYRPQFHFSVEKNKLGNPIDLICIDSVYHLFFQYNEHNLKDGYMQWGHATSSDLIFWEYDTIALQNQAQQLDSMDYNPWKGSIVEKGEKYYAIFNIWNKGIVQSPINNFSNIPYEGKMINDSLKRTEPSITYNDELKKWIMTLHDSENDFMKFLYSNDLDNWEEIQSFPFKFGFPDMAIANVDRMPNQHKYIVCAHQGVAYIGTFTEKGFSPETPLERFDQNPRLGGSVFFNDKANNRLLMLSLINSKQHADLPSNGVFTIPSIVELHKSGEKVFMTRQPIPEIEKLYDKTYQWEDTKVYPGIEKNLIKKVKGDCFHLKAEIDVLNSDNFGFYFRKGRGVEGTELAFNLKQNIFTGLGSSFAFEPRDGKLTIEILIDRSTIEMFLEDGKYSVSAAFIPDPESVQAELFTKGGEILVEKMEVHSLKSIWEPLKK